MFLSFFLFLSSCIFVSRLKLQRRISENSLSYSSAVIRYKEEAVSGNCFTHCGGGKGKKAFDVETDPPDENGKQYC